MVAWSDYKSAAQKRGSLALELYVIESTPVKAPDELKKILPDHLAYQAEQEHLGNLAFAGPLSDLSGEQMNGSGLIVYRAQSLEDARALADADPMHATQTREYTLRRWMINEGSLQLSVQLSAQKVSLES